MQRLSNEEVLHADPNVNLFFVRVRTAGSRRILGGSRRILHEAEKSKRNMIRRSAFLTSDASKGSSQPNCKVSMHIGIRQQLEPIAALPAPELSLLALIS